MDPSLAPSVGGRPGERVKKSALTSGKTGGRCNIRCIDETQCRYTVEDTMKWVTREKARVDRIACPWLISRFVDKEPTFLFVPRVR